MGSARVRQRHAATVDRGSTVELRITGVIRAGSFEVTPVAECARLHVGDRLIGCWLAPAGHRGRPRLQVQLSSTTEPSSGAFERASQPPSDGLESSRGTWELDTTHMRPRRYGVSLRLVGGSQIGDTPSYGSVAVEFRLEPSTLDRRVA